MRAFSPSCIVIISIQYSNSITVKVAYFSVGDELISGTGEDVVICSSSLQEK